MVNDITLANNDAKPRNKNGDKMRRKTSRIVIVKAVMGGDFERHLGVFTLENYEQIQISEFPLFSRKDKAYVKSQLKN